MQRTFTESATTSLANALADSAVYCGLYAFHKYWGKKPAEPIRYLIQQLYPKGGLVVDPFLGSGISALEAIKLKRRVVGHRHYSNCCQIDSNADLSANGYCTWRSITAS